MMKIALSARAAILIGTGAALLVPVSARSSVSGALNAGFMVGKWSAFGEDCKNVIEFRKDGTAMTPIGKAKWTLTGDKLHFDYGDGSTQPLSTVRQLSHDRIEITRGSGGKETEKRC